MNKRSKLEETASLPDLVSIGIDHAANLLRDCEEIFFSENLLEASRRKEEIQKFDMALQVLSDMSSILKNFEEFNLKDERVYAQALGSLSLEKSKRLISKKIPPDDKDRNINSVFNIELF